MKKSALKRGEKCPIHHSFFCCGRMKESTARRLGWKSSKPGDPDQEVARRQTGLKRSSFGRTNKRKPRVEVIQDPHSPRGEREIVHCPKERRRRLLEKIREQNGHCAPIERGGCGKPFERIEDVEGDHILPKGMGGAFRDDHPSNMQAMHRWCNSEKGSVRPVGGKDMAVEAQQ